MSYTYLPPPADPEPLAKAFYLVNSFRTALQTGGEEPHRFINEHGEELDNALHMCVKVVHRDLLARGVHF